MSDKEDPARTVQDILDQIPPPAVLEAGARPIYDLDGRHEEHICGRGYVLAERWPWVPDGAGKEKLDGGLRLVLLRNRQLRQQIITGRRTLDKGEVWEARTKEIAVEQLLDSWSIEDLIQGVRRIIELARISPRKLLKRLEAADAILDGLGPERRAAAGDPEQVLRHKQKLRRRALWGGDFHDRMGRLCRLFPVLRGAPGTDPWNELDVLRFACDRPTHTAFLAARFVLGVSNSTTDWEGVAREKGMLSAAGHLPRFDLFEAVASWDEASREALLAWVRDPFWS